MIAVFERVPRWAPELKRRFLQSPAVVRGCSTQQDVWNAAGGGATLLLVLDGHEAQCVEIAGRLAARRTSPAVIAVTSDGNADLEWPLREMGAAAVVSDRITSDEMTGLMRRMLAADS